MQRIGGSWQTWRAAGQQWLHEPISAAEGTGMAVEARPSWDRIGQGRRGRRGEVVFGWLSRGLLQGGEFWAGMDRSRQTWDGTPPKGL